VKNVLFLILAFIVALILWGIIKSLLFGLIGTLFHLAMIALFCYLVYLIFKAMTNKQKI